VKTLLEIATRVILECGFKTADSNVNISSWFSVLVQLVVTLQGLMKYHRVG